MKHSRFALSIVLVFFSCSTVVLSYGRKKADISCIIADIKYNHGKVKILELGEVPRSYFKGHEQLYGEGKIWQNLWEYLGTFGLPLWYVGEPLNTVRKQKQIAQETLYKLGGKCFSTVHHLKKDPDFKARMNQSITHDGGAISDYQGIIIFRLNKKGRAEIQTLKRTFPNFIYLDETVSHHVNNKHKTSLAFQTANLNDYRPQWNVYNKKYSPKLSDKIASDFTTNTFVIKPVNSANGWGVIITDKDELDTTLELILQQPNVCAQIRDRSFNQWARDRNTTFLVEEYIASQPLLIETKTYDPTLRVIFVLHYDVEKIGIHFLGSYWKLPELALNDPGTLTKKHKSKIALNKQSSEKVSKQDEESVQEILRSIMPQLYASMLEDQLPINHL